MPHDLPTMSLSCLCCAVATTLTAARGCHHLAGVANRRWQHAHAGIAPNDFQPQEGVVLPTHGIGAADPASRSKGNGRNIPRSAGLPARAAGSIAHLKPPVCVAINRAAARRARDDRLPCAWGFATDRTRSGVRLSVLPSLRVAAAGCDGAQVWQTLPQGMRAPRAAEATQ